MTDEKRLRDKLAKLAAEEDAADGHRVIRGPGGAASTRAILTEIDETILPRRLTFRRADGAELALEVANRRLLALAEKSEAGEASFALPPDDDGALADVADILAGFAARPGDLAVAAGPLARTADPGAHGRSVEALSRALGIDLYAEAPDVSGEEEAPPAPPAEGGFGRLARAVVEIGDGAPGVPSGTDDRAVARLSGLDPAALGTLLAELGAPHDRPGRFLLLAAGPDALFLGQRDAATAVLALLPPGTSAAAVALWRATRGA